MSDDESMKPDEHNAPKYTQEYLIRVWSAAQIMHHVTGIPNKVGAEILGLPYGTYKNSISGDAGYYSKKVQKLPEVFKDAEGFEGRITNLDELIKVAEGLERLPDKQYFAIALKYWLENYVPQDGAEKVRRKYADKAEYDTIRAILHAGEKGIKSRSIGSYRKVALRFGFKDPTPMQDMIDEAKKRAPELFEGLAQDLLPAQNIDMERLREKLKELHASNLLSLETVAHHLDIEPDYYQRKLDGKTPFTVGNIKLLREICPMDFRQFEVHAAKPKQDWVSSASSRTSPGVGRHELR